MLSDEETRAIQKASETTGKALDLARNFGGFFKEVFGDSIVEFAQIPKDWAVYLKEKNALKVKDKYDEIINNRKLKDKTIPIEIKHALPIIEGISKEFEEPVQDMWAGLLANATDPNIHLNIKKTYMRILSDLEPLDVSIINQMNNINLNIIDGKPSEWFCEGTLLDRLRVDMDDLRVSLQTLGRLQCIESTRGNTWDSIEIGLGIGDPKATFRLTHLGKSLVKACQN